MVRTFKNDESLPILNANEKNKINNYESTGVPRSYDRLPTLSYPRAVLFVLCSKFFESFAANGVRTVLALYLRDSLSFSEESSTSFYHIFNFFSQFCPIFGAVLADSYFGNAKTIYYIFFIYATGWIGMIALTFPIQSVPVVPLVMTSLILISIGNGSIRACITSLGGSQFQLPQQSKQLSQFFSQYYFVYTMGIMLSKIFPPSIRAHTKCFGHNDCYAAVFGALGAIFLISWMIFALGMFFYKQEEIDQTEGNILFKVIGCIWYGTIKKFKNCSIAEITSNSFIDGSVGLYSVTFVEDVAAFLRVLKLFLPLPIYWALFAQIDSSWTFQATQLNTTVFNFRFEADQAKAMGAIMLLFMIPLWQNICIPLLWRIDIEIPALKSVALGGICAALSFVSSGILQIAIERNSNETDDPSQKLSFLWQIPQFFLIMMGEVLLSIPGLQFSFTQAPPSMKSVLTAAWFCNNAFGNLIVVAITQLHLFTVRSNEFFLYSFLMFVCTLIFCGIARNYRYSNYDEEDSVAEDDRHSIQEEIFKSKENLELIL